MICCDVFELDATIDGRMLRWNISTDLPGGTRVIASVSRPYTDTRGNECIWTLWSDAVLLTPTGPGDRNGASGTLDIDEGDARGLSRFNKLLVPYSAGVLTPIEGKVTVEFTVGARQPLKAFGKNNSNLSGGMVFDSGGINVVRESVVLGCEMRAKYQPIG